jgi:hypothetical protein|tara:strand:- start:205 stop:753 length:549 start_codon:yes stop_codon:yes gene_type:complete
MKIFKIPEFLSIEECDILYDRILETEEHVKSLGDDLHNGTADNSLTGRHWCHNYLNDKVVSSIIVPKLRIIVGRKKFIQCWANTFREGEGIARHCHRNANDPLSPPTNWTCTNLFIGGDPGVGTWFEGEKHENHRGELMMFSSSVYHWVPPNKSSKIRITMAMDIHSSVLGGHNDQQYYKLN